MVGLHPQPVLQKTRHIEHKIMGSDIARQRQSGGAAHRAALRSGRSLVTRAHPGPRGQARLALRSPRECLEPVPFGALCGIASQVAGIKKNKAGNAEWGKGLGFSPAWVCLPALPLPAE